MIRHQSKCGRRRFKTLIETRPPDLRSICTRLLRVRFLNAVAARGWLDNDPATGRTLAAAYRSFHPSERSNLLEILSRALRSPEPCSTRSPRARFPVGSGRLPRPPDSQPG